VIQDASWTNSGARLTFFLSFTLQKWWFHFCTFILT